MSYADVTAQMQQIQAQLALLAPQRPAAATAGSGAAFTSALSAATAGTGATTAATAVDGTALATSGVTGDDVVTAALQYKGVPYVLGGESKSGIDCSGLVQASFKDLGVSVPRLVHEQQTIGEKVDSLKDAKPGDLIVLNGGDHIAIYAGNDMVIHAPYPGRTVSLQKEWFTDKDVVTIRRVVPSGDAAGTSGASATGSTAAAATSSAASTSSSGLSAAALARAVGMVGMYGAATGSDSGASSLSSMLGGLGGTSTNGSDTSSLSSLLGTASGTTGSSSTAQQLLAARAAMLEGSAA